MEEKIQIIKDDEIDLRALTKVIWAGRWFIALITGTFTLIGVVHALLATPYYMSTITLYPTTNETGGALGQLQGLASSFGYSVGGVESSYNIPDVVKSRRIRRMILEQHWMTEKYIYPVDLITFWGINDTTTTGISLNPLSWVKTIFTDSHKKNVDSAKEWEEIALGNLGELITVSEDNKTGLIRVIALMEEPQLAADIANYVTAAVTDYIQTENSFKASRDRTFIEERLGVVKKELEQAETDLKEFRQENRRIADSPELQLEQGRLLRQVEMKQQVYITLQQQLELARIDEVKKTPVIHTLDIAEAAIRKDKPKRKMIVFMALILGGVFSTAVHLIRHNTKR